MSKYGPEKTPYLDTFHAVNNMDNNTMNTITWSILSVIWKSKCKNKCMNHKTLTTRTHSAQAKVQNKSLLFQLFEGYWQTIGLRAVVIKQEWIIELHFNLIKSLKTKLKVRIYKNSEGSRLFDFTTTNVECHRLHNARYSQKVIDHEKIQTKQNK